MGIAAMGMVKLPLPQYSCRDGDEEDKDELPLLVQIGQAGWMRLKEEEWGSLPWGW